MRPAGSWQAFFYCGVEILIYLKTKILFLAPFAVGIVQAPYKIPNEGINNHQ